MNPNSLPNSQWQTNPLLRVEKPNVSLTASTPVVAPTTPTQTVATTVSANELANPPAPVQAPFTPPAVDTGELLNGLVGNVSTGTQSYIEAQSEEAARAKELAGLLGSQEFDGAGQRNQMNESFGVPENLARLKDIQIQLAKANTESAVTQTRIAGGAGQTLAQGQREITQEQRENAVRTAGIAAEASVLQGNIETASTLINQAMTDYYQDRTLRNQNMIQQLDYFSGIADKQTSQLLQKEQRKYEEDQRQIVRAEGAVDAAVVSGYATAEDIKKLTSLSGDPTSQASYAQSIVANAARQAAAIERSKLAISQQNADLSRRQSLFELASMGDPSAISELGFDPTAPLKEEEQKTLSNQIDAIDKTTFKLTEALSNKIGMQSSSGEWQFGEATIKGLLTSENEIPGIGQLPGGLSGAVKARQQKSTFLATVDNLLTKEGLMEIGDLAEQGIKLTPITEKELAILFQSASTLNSASKRDEGGKLIGFSVPDYIVERELQQMLLAQSNVKAELSALKNLGSGTFAELEAIRTGQQ